mgnify:CR=1 FL=1
MRIISLLPAATEMVAALGATEHLVGVSHECDHPAIVGSRARVTASAVDSAAAPATIDAQVRALHETGAALYALDEPLIRALRPDLIITQALCEVCAVSETDVRALAARLDPVPAIVTISATTLEGIFDDLVRVAAALDRAGDGVGVEIDDLAPVGDAERGDLRRGDLLHEGAELGAQGDVGPEDLHGVGVHRRHVDRVADDAVAQEITASGAVGIFRFLNSQGTTVCQAAGTIAAGDTIHAAAAGQVTNSGTDPVVGRAMSAGTAGNPIEVLVNRGQL